MEPSAASIRGVSSPRTKSSMSLVNRLRRRLFNDVKFRVCFTIANYKNDIISLCEPSNVCAIKKMYFHQRNPL